MTQLEKLKRKLDLDKLVLLTGSHDPNKERQMCVMEAVAYVAGEKWSDSPKCASGVIAHFLRRLNDRLNDTDRQALKPLIPKLVGTAASDQVEDKRRDMLRVWLAHEWLPMWLELAGLKDEAEECRKLDVTNVRDSLWKIRDIAYKTRNARLAVLRENVTAKVKELLKDKPVADADAVADAAAAAAAAAVAVAAADAVAVAAAAAAAVSVAAADAAAFAAAVAVAVAAADAVAVAVAVAGAVAGSVRYWDIRDAAYRAAYKVLRPKYDAMIAERFGADKGAMLRGAIEIVEKLIEVRE